MLKKIQAEYHTECFRLFMKHFENLQQLNWSKLDIASGDEVLRTQGENRILKQLLQIKVKREAKYAKYDGAVGVQ